MIHRNSIVSILWISLPLLTTIVFIFFGAIPFSIFGLRDVMPYWGTIAVCFWSIYRPQHFSIYFAFFVGILADGLAGTPFGLHAFIYTAAYWFIQSQRPLFLQSSFMTVWFGFGIIALGASAVSVIFMSIVSKALILDPRVILKTLTTIVVYPWVAWGLIRIISR